MIRDRAAYERLRAEDERRALRELDDEDALTMAEALLTSSVLAHCDFRRAPRPLNLARSLGIDASRVVRAIKPTGP